MRTITRNGPGTWSSDSEEVISAAAECFWEETTGSGLSGISKDSIIISHWSLVAFTYPKGPKAKDNDDKVDSVSQEHKHIHISYSTVVWVDEVVEELSDGHIYLQSPEKQRPHPLASGEAQVEKWPDTTIILFLCIALLSQIGPPSLSFRTVLLGDGSCFNRVHTSSSPRQAQQPF